MEERSTTLSAQQAAGGSLAASRLEVIRERNRANELQREIAALRGSRSWRWTKPLRFIAGALMKPYQWLLRLCYESPAFAWLGKPLAKLVYVWGLPGTGVLLPHNTLFSPDFYAGSNRDLKNNRNLWAHYLAFGADEGRNPHPLFATTFYCSKNSDVAASKLNPLIHYVAHGAAEERSPHPAFDPHYYFTQRPDAKSK